MATHIISHYKEDDFKMVAYCKVCGKEEPEIYGTECEGQFNPQKTEKPVDKKEQKY